MTPKREDLPRGWVWASLKDICDINPKHTSALGNDLRVSFVPMAAVDEATGEIRAAVDRVYAEVRKGYTHFADGDVLWAKITPCMENGKAAVARGLTNGIGCGTTEFFVLRSRGAILPEYLHRFMRQPSYRAAARETMQSGVGQARVPKEFIEETCVPLPPIEEQRRIVARLGELRAHTDVVRTSLSVVPTLFEQYRRSILTAAFSGSLTGDSRAQANFEETASELRRRLHELRREEWQGTRRTAYTEAKSPTRPAWTIPDSWCWASLEELTSAVDSICYGIVQPGDHIPGGIRLVRVTDVENGSVLSEGLRTVSREVDSEYARSRLKGEEVLVTVVGTIGRVAVAPPSLAGANIARAVARLRVLPPVSPEWVAFALMTPAIQDQLARESREVARKTLNVGSLARIAVPIAPIEEMRKVVIRINVHLGSVHRQLLTVAAARSQTEDLESTMLAKAFRGQLVPQDLTDEPASIRRAGMLGKN